MDIKTSKAPVPYVEIDRAEDVLKTAEKHLDEAQDAVQRALARVRHVRSVYGAYHPEAKEQPVFPVREIGSPEGWATPSDHLHDLEVLLTMQKVLKPIADANGDRWKPRVVLVYDPA